MVSCMFEGEEKITDLFLTQEQADGFHQQLTDRILQNASKE